MIKFDRDIFADIDEFVTDNKNMIKFEYNKSVDSRYRNNEKLEYSLDYELKIERIYQEYLYYEENIFGCMSVILKNYSMRDRIDLFQGIFSDLQKIDEFIDKFKSTNKNFYCYMNIY